jgi:hypothetical protein
MIELRKFKILENLKFQLCVSVSLTLTTPVKKAGAVSLIEYSLPVVVFDSIDQPKLNSYSCNYVDLTE